MAIRRTSGPQDLRLVRRELVVGERARRVQLGEVFDLIRRGGRQRCILRLILRLLLFFLSPAAVTSDRGSRCGSHDQPTAP